METTGGAPLPELMLPWGDSTSIKQLINQEPAWASRPSNNKRHSARPSGEMEVNPCRKRTCMIPESRLVKSGEGGERVQATPGFRLRGRAAHIRSGAIRVIPGLAHWAAEVLLIAGPVKLGSQTEQLTSSAVGAGVREPAERDRLQGLSSRTGWRSVPRRSSHEWGRRREGRGSTDRCFTGIYVISFQSLWETLVPFYSCSVFPESQLICGRALNRPVCLILHPELVPTSPVSAN